MKYIQGRYVILSVFSSYFDYFLNRGVFPFLDKLKFLQEIDEEDIYFLTITISQITELDGKLLPPNKKVCPKETGTH